MTFRALSVPSGKGARQRTQRMRKILVPGTDRAKLTKVRQGRRGDIKDPPSTSVSLVGKE